MTIYRLQKLPFANSELESYLAGGVSATRFLAFFPAHRLTRCHSAIKGSTQ